MSGMLVAVTGGTGLVGSHSAAALVAAGDGAIDTCACATAVDDGQPLPPGVCGRPVAESMADTVRWLHATGRLTDKQAGAAVSGAPVAEPTGGSR